MGQERVSASLKRPGLHAPNTSLRRNPRGGHGRVCKELAAHRIGCAMDIRRNFLEAQMLTATGPEREAAIRRLQLEMNRPRNALTAPSLPLTYTPPETRGGQ
jgi:hypothetical protein